MSKNQDTVTEIPLSEIRDFPDHPYQVRDDESMNELVESIKEQGLIQPILVRLTESIQSNGILTPIAVRKLSAECYEVISGHRRLYAAKKLGLEVIPAVVHELSYEEAVIAMVDANLQREHILPSEKAKGATRS